MLLCKIKKIEMKNILILEDEIAIWMLYKRKLEWVWFEVQHALNPDQMDEILKEFKPDIFLLDHWITGHEKTWTECVPELRKKFPDSGIFILSNYWERDLKLKFPWGEFSPDEYLLKLNCSPRWLVEFLS